MEKTKEEWLRSYSGLDLLKENNLSDVKIYVVRGEDPNCDMGGCHSKPILGYYLGRLTDVIDIAIKLPNFYIWGRGGKIEPIEIININKH